MIKSKSDFSFRLRSSSPEQNQDSDEDDDPAEGLVPEVGQEGEVDGGAAATVVRWDNLSREGWMDSMHAIKSKFTPPQYHLICCTVQVGPSGRGKLFVDDQS